MSGHETDPAHGDAGGETAREASTPDLARQSPAKTWINVYRKNEVLFLCCLLMLTVAVVFTPALRNDFINNDDPEYVTANPHVQHGLTWEGVRWAFVTSAASNW